jgi:predicted house-cleaning noncanonical NTP pyrophosphatase (MazG superfamily)
LGKYDKPVIVYNKLVRDNIPGIIEENNSEYDIHIASDKEYVEKLFDKALEEIEEFKEEPITKEMADIMEVLIALCNFYGLSLEEVESVRKERAKKRGAFEQRIILEEVRKKN